MCWPPESPVCLWGSFRIGTPLENIKMPCRASQRGLWVFPECSLARPVVLIKICETLYVKSWFFNLPPLTFKILQFVGILSTQGGYPFVFLAHQRIYNPFVWSMSVFRVCYVCLCSFVRLWQMTRFCVFIYWTHRDHTQTTQRPHTETHREHTLSVFLSLSIIYTWRDHSGGFFLSTSKKRRD